MSSLALRPWGMAGASVPHAILHAALDGLADRLLGLGEHLGRLGLQLGRGAGHVHAVGEVGRRDEEQQQDELTEVRSEEGGKGGGRWLRHGLIAAALS